MKDTNMLNQDSSSQDYVGSKWFHHLSHFSIQNEAY